MHIRQNILPKHDSNHKPATIQGLDLPHKKSANYDNQN